MDRTADLESLLRSARLKRTPVRLSVLQILADAPHPLGVADVLQRMSPGTDSVTVYRTLNSFTTAALVHRVRGDDRVWRYALSAPETPARHLHAHFVCDHCGGVECLKDAPIPPTLLPSLHVAPGYDVSYPEILVHGLCPRCHE